MDSTVFILMHFWLHKTYFHPSKNHLDDGNGEPGCLAQT